MELKAFLSHRYKSPDVNLYFHELFSEVAEVQFEVDVGVLPINVTRLERMVRDSNAFIGIYPYPGKIEDEASLDQLNEASQYFRFECDLAIRSGKPTLIFYDQRYAQVFAFPSSFHVQGFDIQEVTARDGSPNRDLFSRIFKDFAEEVKAEMNAAFSGRRVARPSEVGLLLPQDGPKKGKYENRHINAIKELLHDGGFQKIKELSWPPMLNVNYLTQLQALDWVIADIGELTMKSGIIGFLHGQFTPTLRLLKGVKSRKNFLNRQSSRGLFGGIEVGYTEDVIAWDELGELKEKVKQSIDTLKTSVKRITSRRKSEAYFLEASLRKEPVFLSYSGKDERIAFQISEELKRRFQTVFNYKDGKSITPGEPWLEEIFDKLSTASLGIPLLSANYFDSGNCEHEAQVMMEKRDAKGMVVIPVSIDDNYDSDLPTWMSSIQFMHFDGKSDIPTFVEKIISAFIRILPKLS